MAKKGDPFEFDAPKYVDFTQDDFDEADDSYFGESHADKERESFYSVYLIYVNLFHSLLSPPVYLQVLFSRSTRFVFLGNFIFISDFSLLISFPAFISCLYMLYFFTSPTSIFPHTL